MISPIAHDLGNEVHVSHAVVCPKSRNVFLRLMNTFGELAELKSGTKVATFSQLMIPKPKCAALVAE